VGKHKHLVIIKLQALIGERTGRVIPVETLWEVLGQLYDLEALDDMVSLGALMLFFLSIRTACSLAEGLA
jgi:hypothetical protein